ncbi:hypothetical protein G6F56_003014 [Rhizopus delemar]|nr:hypothetical protein G6F56_003014 [Rhizopus delemar]
MSVFITVGSTGFDDLIQETTTQEFLTCLLELNIKRVVFQYGSSEPVFAKNIQSYEGPRIDIEGYRYKPSITKDILTSDIIISHAGSGTMLQTLRLQGKKLIMVVNKSLLDNHQLELAKAMHKNKYAICSDLSNLSHNIQNINQFNLQPFPQSNKEIFGKIIDNHMGFQ